VTGAHAARRARVECERPAQETLAERDAEADGQEAALPGGERAQADLGQEHQDPGEEPAGLEPAAQRGGAEDPPSGDAEHVLDDVGSEQSREPARRPHGAELLAQVGGGIGAQEPADPDVAVVEGLVAQQPHRAIAPDRRHLGAIEHAGQVGGERRLLGRGPRGLELVDRDPVAQEARPQHLHAVPVAAEHAQDAGHALHDADRQQRGAAVAQHVAERALGDHQRLGLEPQPLGRGLDPDIDVVVVDAVDREGRQPVGAIALRQAGVVGERADGVAGPLERPGAIGEIDHRVSASRTAPSSTRIRRKPRSPQNSERTCTSASRSAR
jgi:hypothetical protein